MGARNTAKLPKVFKPKMGHPTQTEQALVTAFVKDQPGEVSNDQVIGLARATRRSPRVIRGMIEKAREELVEASSDYVKAHREAMQAALANGDPKSLDVARRAAEWGMENISQDDARIVDRKKEADGGSSGPRIFVGLKIGGLKQEDLEGEIVEGSEDARSDEV